MLGQRTTHLSQFRSVTNIAQKKHFNPLSISVNSYQNLFILYREAWL